MPPSSPAVLTGRVPGGGRPDDLAAPAVSDGATGPTRGPHPRCRRAPEGITAARGAGRNQPRGAGVGHPFAPTPPTPRSPPGCSSAFARSVRTWTDPGQNRLPPPRRPDPAGPDRRPDPAAGAAARPDLRNPVWGRLTPAAAGRERGRLIPAAPPPRRKNLLVRNPIAGSSQTDRRRPWSPSQ
jgi:hypothetical protein